MRVTIAATVVLLVSTTPSVGTAQTEHPSDDNTSAAPLALTVEAQAQQRYQDGRAHYHNGDFPQALEDFRTSLQMADSPNTRMYLGRTLRQLGRLAEAFTTLDRAASDAADRVDTEPRYIATRDSARTEADALRPQIAFLVVRVLPPDPAIELRVNGEFVPRAAWGVPTAMQPGALVAVARGEGFQVSTGRINLAAGQQAALDLPVEAVAPTSTPVVTSRTVHLAGHPTPHPWSPPVAPLELARWRTAGWVTGAVGAATLLTSGAFHIAAWEAYSTLEGQRSDGAHTVDRSLLDAGEDHQSIAIAGYIVGGALLIAGAACIWMGLHRGESPARALGGLDPTRATGLSGTF